MIIVCTFATEEFAGSAEVLRHTALHDGGADAVVVYREADVAEWFREHPELLRAPQRGYGFWSWKAWCIARTLRLHAAPGDVVVYCDAGVAVTAPLAAHAAATRHVLLFRLGGWTSRDYTNAAWTKRGTFELMGLDTPAHRAAVQVNAGVQMYRRTPEALEFVDAYAAWSARRDVLDDPDPTDRGGIRDHRHDQSVVSLLAVGHAAVDVARDPTQFGADDPPLGPPLLPVGILDHHRQRLRPARVAVVTPTTAGRFLARCVASVQAQDLPNVVHYVVVDGPEHEAAAREALAPWARRKPVHVTVLPHNVGARGWNGHRVYGAWPWLVDADFVAFLDDDNEFDADHLRHLVRAVAGAGTGPQTWGHSLRRIVDADGAAVCDDNCESLGGIAPTACGGDDRLVDTSCYLLPTDLARAACPAWNARFRDPEGRPEPDRFLAKMLLASAPHVCVRRHSVAYRVGSTPASVSAAFFLRANARLGYDFAAFEDLYVFHFSPEATARMLACRRARDRSYALDEWQMTLLRGLDGLPGGGAEPGGAKKFNLLDGYACAPDIPHGARVLVCMCQPHQVPWDFLKARPDLRRAAYTLESPNVRHAAQWDPVLLADHFDVVLTYWTPLLEDPRVSTVFCAHNTHHLDMDDPLDAAQLRANRGTGASCAMVLERRDLRGTYAVPNMPAAPLRCLDPLRERLVTGMRGVTVFGVGWDAVADRCANVRLGHALHRSRDPRHAVDILQDYTFALIVENTDAEGYASEKLYDALLAGCVPLYFGSVPPQLGVPEGPEAGLYLDLRRFLGYDADPEVPRAGERLQAFLDSLAPDTVAAWKARVAAGREAVLRRVDTRAFAACVTRAFEV